MQECVVLVVVVLVTVLVVTDVMGVEGILLDVVLVLVSVCQ